MREPGRLITVFSATGGCGKTTVATNLAAALADDGRRNVCVVDIDLAFGDVAGVLGQLPSHTIADALPVQERLERALVAGLVVPHSPGLSFLAAPFEPGLAEHISATLVTRVVELLRTTFDVLVIDTPSALDDHVVEVVSRSDHVVLVTTSSTRAARDLELTAETLDLLQFPRDRWRIVVNRYDGPVAPLSRPDKSNVPRTLPAPVAAYVPASRDVARSTEWGAPLVLAEPDHAVSQAIARLASSLVGET